MKDHLPFLLSLVLISDYAFLLIFAPSIRTVYARISGDYQKLKSEDGERVDAERRILNFERIFMQLPILIFSWIANHFVVIVIGNITLNYLINTITARKDGQINSGNAKDGQINLENTIDHILNVNWWVPLGIFIVIVCHTISSKRYQTIIAGDGSSGNELTSPP